MVTRATPPETGHARESSPPLAQARRLAELAFGSFSRFSGFGRNRHLALLPAESLELDLDDPAQRRFGDYELLEYLGEGGMGVVYRARQNSLDREVAIKLLSAGPWASREFIARFEREAQNAALMQHPNIVTVYEVGSSEGLYFFSMRLVRGESLAGKLRRGERFSPRAAAGLLRTVAEAVDYAHNLGMLHLDLKPSNVLLDEDGTPCVADFGLARRLENALAIENDEISGTPAYMAPEQAQVRANKLTRSTDIWGLGAVLYELLTGEPPFRADTAEDTVRLVLQGLVHPPRRRRPMLPRDLEAIVLRCLSRGPEARYASARALADDLQRYIDGRPVQARPLNAMQRVARWTRREPRLAATALLAFGILVIGLVATAQQWRRAISNGELAQQTLWASRSANAQREIAAGNAYPALANAAANLREMEARGDRDDAALERLRIGTVLASAPQLIDVIPVAGAKANDIDALAFSPDAKLLAFRTGEGRTIRLVDVASGRELWKVDITDKSFGMYDMRNWPIGLLRFSGDGQRLVAYTLDYNPGGALSTMRPHYLDSVMIDVATGKVVEPPKAFTDFLATDYADDARFALLFDKHGGVQRWRTQPWRPAGDKVQFKDNLTVRTDYGLGPLLGEALLPASGNPMVLVSNANLKFRTYDARHMRPLRSLSLDSAQGRGTAWAFSADEKQLAIGTVTGQIALWNLATGATRWLQPQLSGTITTLRFSADDSRLLAMSNEPSELRVFDPRSGAMVAEPVKLSDDLSPNVVSGIGAEFGSNASTLLTHHWAGNATLWQLPAPGFPLRPPVAIAPTMTALGARFALATDPRSRLMATAENGSIKLWRLRSSPLTDRVAPPMVTDVLHFDGHHLVSVAGNRVSVFDAATDRTVGTTIVLPQAPTFAVLVGGTRLIAIAGRELGCWNWRNGKACWPVLTLPDSLLRLGFAAQAPVLALSTGSNVNGVFFEHVRLVDLASGRQRGGTIDLRGPLGTLRLSDDGRLLMAWEDAQSRDALRDVLYVIDADNGAIVRRLVHRHGAKGVQSIYDARLMTDGSIFSITNCSWDRPNCDDTGGYLWHWSADGHVIAKTRDDGLTGDLLPMPASRGIIELVYERWLRRQGKPIELAAPDSNSLDDAAAVSPDGRLLALAAINGVALTDIPHNESLLPELKLPLPNDEMVQQLAFSPDDSRLIGRTTSGRWFQWPIVSDQRPVPEIERDVGFRDLSQLGSPHPPLPDAQRRQLRAADPGPLPVAAESDIRAVDADVPAPVPDARYQPLDIDPIANVDPRHAMTHATRNPPQPQSLPSLPRGLQRYDGVDFLLSRAVQLSGQPQNLLDAEFPSASRSLVIGRRRIEAVDAMVMQYISLQGVIGSMQLHYADGSDRTLDIMSPRDTVQHWIDAQHVEPSLRMGWLGSYAQQLMIPIGANGESTFSRSYIVRLVNPEPNKAVVSISLGAPPRASPGLLFLALTLEPVQRVPNQRKVALARPR